MLTIKVEASAGDDITATVESAIRLAKQLHVRVQFPFNGIEVNVLENCTTTEVVNAFSEAQRFGGDAVFGAHWYMPVTKVRRSDG